MGNVKKSREKWNLYKKMKNHNLIQDIYIYIYIILINIIKYINNNYIYMYIMII